MPPSELLAPLASHGVLGIFTAVALWSAWTKDRELKACQEARLQDSKESTAKLLDVVSKVYAAVDSLGDTADKLYETRKTP